MSILQLSVQQARKLIVHQQLLNSRSRLGSGESATLTAIENMGYVQLDTLSVVSRAHNHTLWNRLAGYRPAHIDFLQRQGLIFEHWAHALAILPMRDYRFSLPMMKRIAAGEVHWYRKDKKKTDWVLARIRDEGPLMAKDFDDKPASKAMWARSPSKRALEQLFMEGELMVPYRNNFHKVYDLRERVLPADVNVTEPSEDEFCRHLIHSYLRANTLGQPQEVAYLRRGKGATIKQLMFSMAEDGELLDVEIDKTRYYALPDLAQNLESALPPSGLRILSPFDNAIIQRQRLLRLFNFDYQIECYVKKENRKFGYFCLPILYRNKLVGRIDAKADRRLGIFRLLHLHIEQSVGNKEAFYRALFREVEKFAQFNQCSDLALEQVSGCDEAQTEFEQRYG